MRKALVLLTGIVLSMFLFSCSEDDTSVTPSPTPDELEIVTASVPSGNTCTPYNISLVAQGGTEPYTWSLAAGSLPTGMTLDADGQIVGVVEVAGSWTFTVECTDNAGTPVTVDQEYTIDIDVPANPSLAIFFDEEASLCSGTAGGDYFGMGTFVDCYMFIMLDESEINCTRGCEFQITVKDVDGNELEHGTDYMFINFSLEADMMNTGSLENGIAIVKSGGAPLYGPNPIHMCTFGLLLFEEFEDISFEMNPNPGAVYPTDRPTIVTCDAGYPLIEVEGRAAAVNW